jgi:hypothetical protein
MFKMFPPTFFSVPVAWLTVLILIGLNAATPLLAGLGITPRLSWTVFIVQALVTAVFVTPLWRLIWRLVPALNRWVYPDLNGEWDVEGETNWDRIDTTLKAANGEAAPVDMRRADEAQLPPLGRTMMRARITQSWINMKVLLWNPVGQGPIKESRTLTVEPFRGEEGRHGLTYVFEQENAVTAVSDERTFMGAARVVRDRDDPNVLCGRMWTDRMWRRGMNTAADIRFTRRPGRSAPVK